MKEIAGGTFVNNYICTTFLQSLMGRFMCKILLFSFSFIIHPVFAMDHRALQQIMETAF